jgi:hypothetical protein
MLDSAKGKEQERWVSLVKVISSVLCTHNAPGSCGLLCPLFFEVNIRDEYVKSINKTTRIFQCTNNGLYNVKLVGSGS